LETAGWRARIPVDQLIHHESWGNKAVLAADDQPNGKG